MANTLSNSEWIEQAALRAVYDSASYSLKQSLGLKFENIKGVICSASSIEPSILINRCFAPDPDLIRDVSNIVAVKQFYADIGVGEFLLHIYSPDLETQSALQQAGMKKSRGWMKFTRDISPAAARKSDLVIRKIGEEHAEAFARIVVPCFDMTEASIPLVASIISHPHWQLYMGFDGEMPAATGGLFYKDGAAYTDWGSTHTDFRRRGFQGALLAHRINEAIQMGAKSIYTATGEEVPGDPQHSYKNIMRYSFTENYLRENWSPA